MTLSVNDFTAGDVITASAMNTNFATIEGYVNSSPGLAQLTGATFSGAVTFSAGITSTGGTTALGTTNITGEVNVGTSGSGHDVYFHSATASDNLHWDASDEKLVITGTAGQDALHVAAGNVNFDGALDVSGTTNLDVVDIDGAVNIAANLTFAGSVSGANPIAKMTYVASGSSSLASHTRTNSPAIFVNASGSNPTSPTTGDIWIGF